MSDLFSVDKFYTCIKSDYRNNDIFFEIGYQYRCVSVENRLKFSTDLVNDKSVVKFQTHEGHIVSYFGCISIHHFSNDNLKIQKSIDVFDKLIEDTNQSIESLELQLNRKKQEQFNYKQKLNRLKINL